MKGYYRNNSGTWKDCFTALNWALGHVQCSFIYGLKSIQIPHLHVKSTNPNLCISHGINENFGNFVAYLMCFYRLHNQFKEPLLYPISLLLFHTGYPENRGYQSNKNVSDYKKEDRWEGAWVTYVRHILVHHLKVFTWIRDRLRVLERERNRSHTKHFFFQPL